MCVRVRSESLSASAREKALTVQGGAHRLTRMLTGADPVPSHTSFAGVLFTINQHCEALSLGALFIRLELKLKLAWWGFPQLTSSRGTWKCRNGSRKDRAPTEMDTWKANL